MIQPDLNLNSRCNSETDSQNGRRYWGLRQHPPSDGNGGSCSMVQEAEFEESLLPAVPLCHWYRDDLGV